MLKDRKALILDGPSMQRSITRMAHEILERNKGLEDVSLVGILTRGSSLAERIAQKLESIEGQRPPVLAFDARPYRDDIVATELARPSVSGFEVHNRIIVLVDDVLFTGRTVRAALDGIMLAGRAKMVQLAVLIDRGHRELPIRPDFVGKNVPTGQDEEIVVLLHEVDGEDGVWIHNPR